MAKWQRCKSVEDMVASGDRASFRHRDLRGADFSNQDVIAASFVRCNLEGANFRGTNLRYTEFYACTGVDIRGAGDTVLTRVDASSGPSRGYTGPLE